MGLPGHRISDPGWACAQTVNRFFRSLDENRLDEAAALFIAEGVWLRRGEPIKGREAILAALGERPADRVTRHLVTNTVIDADREDMIARYDVTLFSFQGAFTGPAPLSAPHTILSCEDRLVETPSGWLFASRSSRVAFASN